MPGTGPVRAPVVAHGFARTPVAALDSELSGWRPVDLAVVVVREVLNRAQATADRVDEVILGCAEPVGSQGADVARAIVLSAGWPAAIGGMVVERGETSGMSAIQVAADAVRFAYTWAGSDALRQPSVLGRCFRDMHAGTQHLFVDNNTLSDAGALLLAGPSSAPTP